METLKWAWRPGGQGPGQGRGKAAVGLRTRPGVVAVMGLGVKSWCSSRMLGSDCWNWPLCTLLHAPPAIAYIQFSHGPIYWSVCQINTTKISPVLGIHNLLCIRIYENTAVIRICRDTSTHYTLSSIFKVWRSTLLLDFNPRVLHLYWHCQLLWAGSTDTHLTTTEFHCMVTKLT